MRRVSGTRGRRKDSEVRLQTPTHTLNRAMRRGGLRTTMSFTAVVDNSNCADGKDNDGG